MRFSLPDSYFEFFLRNQILEIENLMTLQDVETLCKKHEELLLKHMNQKPLNLASNLELWKAGKDLWKEDPEVKKVLFRLQLGEISHILFKQRPIRLACTQALFTGDKQDSLFSETENLQNISSIGPLLGGVLLCLDTPVEQEALALLPDLKTLAKGRAFFFSGEYQIPFAELFQQKRLKMILLCFAPGKIRYKLEPKDPHTHELKKLGCGFGDSLPEELCPYLYR
jgi:hypothetical protein